METVVFKLRGNTLGTRLIGKQFREEIAGRFSPEHKVILDFDGVEIISNSFADECIGKLVSQYGINELKKKTTFKNTNENVSLVLKKVINDRINNT